MISIRRPITFFENIYVKILFEIIFVLAPGENKKNVEKKSLYCVHSELFARVPHDACFFYFCINYFGSTVLGEKIVPSSDTLTRLRNI